MPLRTPRYFSGLIIIALIIFAIVVTLISPTYGGGVDGRVYVIVPKAFVEWFEREGYALGSLIVAMMSPTGYESYSHWLRDVAGKRLEHNFAKVARSWEEFYQGDVGGRVLKTSPPLPTVSITITLSREEGGNVLECIAQYTYSTIDYFIERGLPVVEAVRKAGEDPLALLREPLTIILKPRMPKGDIEIACFDLSPILERLKEAMDGKAGLATVDDIGSTKVTADSRMEVTQSCPEFTRVWWTSLYNSRDTPPQGWYNNIYHPSTSIPDSEKLGVWRFYAERYSMAYYWPTSRYTAETAMQATLAMLQLSWEGLYSMDGWIHRMFLTLYGRAGVQWKDYNENYGYADTVWSGYTPYIGIYIENSHDKPFAAGGSLAVGAFKYYRKGVSVAGIIFIGREELSTITKTRSISVRSHGDRGYVTVWTAYSYIQDGLLVKLDVKKVVEGLCEYWRVIPVTTIMPLYDVIVDWNYMDVVYGNPDFYHSILYSASVDTIYNNYLVNVPRGSIVYEDSNEYVVVRFSSSTLASILFNLLLEAVDAVIVKNLLCQGSAVCTLFLSIAGDLVNYVSEDLESIGVAFWFSVKADDTVNWATLRIDKITLRASNAYSAIGWRPLMVEYRVYVDSDPDPPPCDAPYCPYIREGG